MSIGKVTLIGAGVMGKGIAQVFAQSGFQVNLITSSQSSVDRAFNDITDNIDKQVKKQLITVEQKQAAIQNISRFTNLQEATAGTDLVIEAVPEKPELKFKLFGELDKVCTPKTILATTTSSVSITQIASFTSRPEKVIGIHFANPVMVNRFAEIVRGISTSLEVVSVVDGLMKKIGKTPVVVNDSPGFVGSRLLAVLINEAIHTVHEGVAGVEEIDEVMKGGLSHPMGILQVADYVGLDLVLNVLNILYTGFKNPKYVPCPLLVNMVLAGHTGVASGKGFYEYLAGTRTIKSVSSLMRK